MPKDATRPRRVGGASFSVGELGLLRAAVFPLTRATETRLDVADLPENAGEIAAYVRERTDDPQFREALAVASPSLADRIAAIRAGNTPGIDGLRKAAFAVTRYWLRMCTRATPFGTMAGVTLARLDGSAAEVRFGVAHRRAVRADAGWLTGLVHRLEGDPRVLPRLRVVVNNLCHVRGDRVIVPYLPDRTDRALADVEVSEASVKHTAVVRAVLDLAARPVAAADLVTRLRERFSGASGETVLRLLAQLVENEVLLTDLVPPLAREDPLAHVIEHLEPDVPIRGELRGIHRMLTEFGARPDDPVTRLRAVRERMRAVHDVTQPVQVDCALDGELRLPAGLGAEAAAAANVLWRVSPPAGNPALREYHAEFLERYGFDRLVPVKELLDSDTGMGPPAGYHVPAATRAEPAEIAEPARRTRFLGQLVQEALLAGEDEIVLDQDIIDRLADDDATPPASAELCVQVLAESADALGAGRFRLAVSPAVGTSSAGSMFGRFARLFPEREQRELGELVRRAQPRDAAPVQLHFRAQFSRGGNVSQVPQWLPEQVTVAGFAETSLDLGDLAIGADADRLFVYSRALGQRIAAATFHVVNIQRAAPNLVRFLAEVSADGTRPVRGWNWGRLSRLPYLPRVRHGRTVLSPAMWQLDGSALRDDPDWTEALQAWRTRLRVPARVYLNRADQRILLDLANRLHLRLLRTELARVPEVLLTELPGEPGEYGWLSGHVSELVVPLIRTGHDDPVVAHRDPAPARTTPARYLPGGEWLYARLPAAAERHPELLSTAVTELAAKLPDGIDRWFFLRYRDTEPHLRLRFHGSPDVLADFLSCLHSWAGELCAAGLARRLTLDTYEPELERFGGPDAMAAAERVFCADSAAALAQQRGIDVDPLLLAAANAMATARAFHTDSESTVDTLTSLFAKEESYHASFVHARKQAMALADPYRDPYEAPIPELADVWTRRAEAAGEYARVLDSLGEAAWTRPRSALRVLLHLQFNRLYGINPEDERRCQAIVRGAAQAHCDRRRFVP